MEKHTDNVEIYYAKDVLEWHNWLAQNHQIKQSVWLVYYKQISGKLRVSYDDAVDEAICFGWIDSRAKNIDLLSSMQFFTPRNPQSNWSKRNKERCSRLLMENRMQAAGLAIIAEAQQNGKWDALNDAEENIIPADLNEALRNNQQAMDYFMKFPRSIKKNILTWIINAKRTATRKRRIEETIILATDNKRANSYRSK